MPYYVGVSHLPVSIIFDNNLLIIIMMCLMISHEIFFSLKIINCCFRGRGIFVAPGFCPASGVRRHVFLWAQKLKNCYSIFFEISTSHS